MTSGNRTSGDRPSKPGRGPDGRPISSLPSVQARVLAFASILVAGIFGALIGDSIVALDCHGGNCGTDQGIGAIVGGVIAAVGVAVVAVLVLRAMGEWKTIKEERALEAAAEAAAAGARAAARLRRPADAETGESARGAVENEQPDTPPDGEEASPAK
jgi:hypothetical protein